MIISVNYDIPNFKIFLEKFNNLLPLEFIFTNYKFKKERLKQNWSSKAKQIAFSSIA